MSAVAVEGEKFLLNPLALSSETTGRFRMLLAAAFTMTWSLAGTWIPTDPFFSVSSLREGESIVNVEGTTLHREDLDFIMFFKAVSSSPEAQAEIWRQWLQLLVSVGLVVTFVVLTMMLFRGMPARAVRRQSARRIDAATAPGLAAELDRLARLAGFKTPPAWYTKLGYLDGHASGHSDRAALVIAGDPRRLKRGLTDVHRAVALHELGHLVNRDTETREGASAAWQTLALLAALTPVALWLAGAPWQSLGQLGLRLAASAVIGLAIWSGLVRSREYFADWRVVQWGYGAALKQRLGLPEASKSTGDSGESLGGVAPWRKWRSWFNFHPSNQARLGMLADPIRLFQVSPILAALTGLLLALTAGHLGIPCFQVVVVSLTPVMAAFLAAGGLPGVVLVLVLLVLGSALLLPLTYWVVGALGTQMLRAAVGDLSAGNAANWGYQRLFFIASSFVVGAEVGLWLTPMGMTGWSAPSWMASWLAIFTVLVWFWLIQAPRPGAPGPERLYREHESPRGRGAATSAHDVAADSHLLARHDRPDDGWSGCRAFAIRSRGIPRGHGRDLSVFPPHHQPWPADSSTDRQWPPRPGGLHGHRLASPTPASGMQAMW